MSDSRSDAIEIRGLVPWLESGTLGAVLLAVARWYETTDMHTRVKWELDKHRIPSSSTQDSPGDRS